VGAQGNVAGVNAGIAAVASSSNNAVVPFILGRDEGYIGVWIDDLVTRGTHELYHTMFISHTE
jgi:tRNA uridine 5-carboxymethylaminomethyl modification enzyme